MQTYKDYENKIATIKRICSAFHLDSLKSQIAAISEVVQEGNIINVALLGRFKAGKSSFLNSILGKNIIPVGILPLTAVITRVRYGATDKVEVLFLNGKTRSIAISELADFIAEKRNPENSKKVARVDVELSCLRDYSSIQFVDTPGLGSIYQHNTLTSKDWIPRVGAAFLTISIDHPLSEDDINLLKELGAHTPEINIILTKIDLASSEEINQVIGFIQSQVQQKLNKDLRIFPFSNKPGYEAQLSAVSEFIQQSIGSQQSSKAAAIITHKFESLLAECHKYLSLGLSMANSTQEAREILIKQITAEKKAVSGINHELWLIANDLKQRLQSDASQMFQTHHSSLLSCLNSQLTEKMSEWTGNIAKTSKKFREWMDTAFTEKLKPVSEECGSKLTKSYLKMALDSYSRMVRAFQDRLAIEIENALNIKFPGAQFEFNPQIPKKPDIHIGSVFMTAWEVIWFLIPMKLFRPLVNRQFIKRLPWDVYINLGRLASQWTDAISNSINDIAQQSKTFIKQEINTVEKLLNEAPDHRKEIEEAISELENIKNDFK